VRLHGSLNFGAGGAFHDVMYVMQNYGLVPEDAYRGLNYGYHEHVHGEFDNVLKAYVDEVIKCKDKKLSTAWMKGYDGILDAYLGELPQSFTFKNVSYTPQSFVQKLVGINPDDYIEIGSFTHHPFYSSFIIEIPDNWLWGSIYNVPMNDLTSIIQNALNNGYSVAWGADVSEKGFSYRNGVAIIPETDPKAYEGTERAKWEKASEKEREKMLYSFDKPVKEKVITQEMRQQSFDNYETTDDHGMHIVGMVKDQNGNIFYKVKNSWNVDNPYKGYFYASEAFVLFKTMDIMIHKDALPKDVRKKLSL
jgi:bleomycin hydrolase